MKYRRLATPIKINKLELKNRMVMPATHLAFTGDGHCTKRFREFYWRRAQGGLGLIIVGSCRFEGYGAKLNSISLDSDDMIPEWKDFTDGMHDRGCPVAVQLYHAGRYIRKCDVPCGRDALSPSAVYSSYTRETAPETSLAQIKTLICNFADGARRAKAAGFDAVEISGSSGYLLCQFLSPLTNLREDEYGGSFENRCRFPLEVIHAVREAVGGDYPILYRLSADDLVPGSNHLPDIMKYVPLAQRAGVDCFNVTGGWHESKIPQLTGDAPRAAFSHFGRSVKSVCDVPVILCNRINTPHDGELALALGDADLVGIGRGCIADPDFAVKAVQNRDAEIRPCVACNQGCLAGAFYDKPVRCLTNSLCGFDERFSESKTDFPKKILVIGGGPAGCGAAILASQKGHNVTLWEKEGRLGGLLRLVSKLPGRGEFERLISYYETLLSKLKVEVRLETTATSENAVGFDKVFLASGGVALMPDIPSEGQGVAVCTVSQILDGSVIAGSRVVVMGGSYLGCQAAQYLLREASLSAEKLMYMCIHELLPQDDIRHMLEGSRRNVTILESSAKIGLGFEPGTGWPVLQDINRLGGSCVTNAVVRYVDSGGVHCRVDSGTLSERNEYFECDTVVVASPPRPDNRLLEDLKSAGADVTAIGSAKAAGKCINATGSAAAAVMALEQSGY